jgi:RHS repeat-associated protein
MGCLKLTYQNFESPLKVVYKNESFEQNNAQRFLSVDPLASKYPAISPYAYVANNPIMFIDPDGREIRLSFASASAQTAYMDLVNTSLGGKYTATVVAVKDGNGYTNQIVLTRAKGVKVKLTKSQRAFMKQYKKAVNNKAIVRQEIVENDANTVVGSWVTGKVDMGDIQEFDNAGPGAATSAGALIHETKEQLEKAKLGLNSGDLGKVATDGSYTDFLKSHKKATNAENKVNGNLRKEQQGYFLEKDGTKTQQTLTPNAAGGVTIQKKKIK